MVQSLFLGLGAGTVEIMDSVGEPLCLVVLGSRHSSPALKHQIRVNLVFWLVPENSYRLNTDIQVVFKGAHPTQITSKSVRPLDSESSMQPFSGTLACS